MIIDLSNSVSMYDNYVNEYKVKSNKLLTEINQININMITKYNYIIIPIAIYNLIEHSDYFRASEFTKNKSGLSKVGWLGEFECYLDLYLEPNHILVSWDKSTSRDMKIDRILSDNNINEKQKKIKVIP